MLRLHRLQDQKALPLLHLVTLAHQHLHHRSRHRGRKARTTRVSPARSRIVHVGRRWLGEPVTLPVQRDQNVHTIRREAARDSSAIYPGLDLAVTYGEHLNGGVPPVQPQLEGSAPRASGLDHALLLARAVAEADRATQAPGPGRVQVVWRCLSLPRELAG